MTILNRKTFTNCVPVDYHDFFTSVDQCCQELVNNGCQALHLTLGNNEAMDTKYAGTYSEGKPRSINFLDARPTELRSAETRGLGHFRVNLGTLQKELTLDKHHSVYSHSLAYTETGGNVLLEYIQNKRKGEIKTIESVNTTYVGLTKRKPGIRFKEHMNGALNGSPTKFHRALVEQEYHYRVSTIIDTGLTFKQAMDLEEEKVDQWGLGWLGLNTIPGGFAGYRYLCKLGAIGKRKKAKDCAGKIEEILNANRHLFKQLDPVSQETIKKMVLNRPSTFTEEQIWDIRMLIELGYDTDFIASKYGGVDKRRIQRLKENKTYQFV